MQGVLTEDYETAAALLEALSPTREEWHRNGGPWIFRGQGDATKSLVPSVLRTQDGPPWFKCLSDLIPAAQVADVKSAEGWRSQAEARLVTRFRHWADRAGLAIPEDSARMRSWRHLDRIIGASPFSAFGGGLPLQPPRRWPQGELLSTVALAQHYGVPTRLLDWTYKPRVAAYFAAEEVMRKKTQGRLAVFALWAQAIDLLWAGQTDDPDVELVQAPQASNPNLAAQAGLFIVARHVHEDVGLETALNDAVSKQGVIRDPLRRLTLPTSEARSLMARLAFEDVSAATVFPGYRGVVDSIREADWWKGAP